MRRNRIGNRMGMRITRGVAALAAVCALTALGPAMALGAAPVNLSPPGVSAWAGEGSTADCEAGQWDDPAAEFTYEWVLDPGGSESVLSTEGPTGAGQDSFTAVPANVNHVLACRVTATNGEGSTGPIYAGGPGPFPNSSLVPPLVSFEVNGATISGDVGGGLSGTNEVTVSLRRDSACQECEAGPGPRTVESKSATIENAAGKWSVTLPTRAVADDRDLLFLNFSGAGPVPGSTTSSGVPPDTTISLHDDPFNYDARSGLMSAMRVWPDPAGSRVVVNDPRCGEDFVCSKVVVHAPNNGGDITATQEQFEGFDNSFTAELTGTATNDDPIGASLWLTRFFDEHPTLLRITKAAPMLGVYEGPGALFDSQGEEQVVVEARLAPKCFAFYSVTNIEGTPPSEARCIDAAGGTDYEVLHSRGVITLGTFPVETEEGQESFGVALSESLAAGDLITLKLAVPSGTRELARTRVGTLRVDLEEDARLLGGECTPGRWLMLSGTVLCPPSGGLDPAEFDNELNQFERDPFVNEIGSVVTLEDDRGGGGTALHVPAAHETVPMDGESVWGSSWQAYANVSDAAFSWAGAGTPTELAYQTWVDPLKDGPWTIVPGNPNTVAGATVSGVPPGRYQGRWRVTDTHGDTNTHYSLFFQQQPQSGPQGPKGATGPAGPKGDTGAQGPSGRDAKVTCKVKQKKKKKKVRVKVTCKVKFVSASASRVRAVGLRLSRSGRLYATGSARARDGRATISMRAVRAVRTGQRFNVTLVAHIPKGSPVSSTARVTMR
jgi:hypothetical protein